MEECIGPVYNVINTIANHSEKLFNAIKSLQNTTIESESNNIKIAEATGNIDYDLCLCNK